MNWVRAYLDQIKGRLILAFGIAALGMTVIWGVSTISLRTYSDTSVQTTSKLTQRLGLTSRLESAISEQLQRAQEFSLTGDAASLAALDSVSATADSTALDYLGRMSDSTVVSAQTHQSQQARMFDVRNRQRTVENEIDAAVTAMQSGRSQEARARMQPAILELYGVRAQVQALNYDELRGVTNLVNNAETTVQKLRYSLTLVFVIALLIMCMLGFITMRAIQRPLRRLVEAANQFGTGDLSVAVDHGNMPGEFRVLAGAFTGMASQFRTIVGETVETANKIGASASDLSAISQEVAASSGEVSTAMIGITQGAEEQAYGLRTVSDALDVMRSRAFDIDTASEQVNRLSLQIGEVAEAKRREVSRALSMLLEVRDLVRSSGEEVNDLQQASESITSFVETIQGIARQTNLLALNAAIEAARAGDHGRGFAVVADEVRKLADGSARAADEVATAVKRISQQIEAVVGTIDRGFSKVAGVEEASKSAESAFEDIVAAVSTVREAASRVAEAASQNRGAVQTVDVAVREVGATAESHAASAQQVSAAAEEQSAATEEMSAASIELLAAADRMKELVAGFRT
ncbi:MAG TPA: methyl-accepting chemotaxis protein [Longimicrobiales bacterium]